MVYSRAHPDLRVRVARVLHDRRVETGLIALIALSVAFVLLEVAFPLGSTLRWVLTRAGDAMTLIFAIELGLRFWTAPVKRNFFRCYVLDLLSLLTVVPPLRLLRVLTLLRLFRAGALLRRRMRLVGGLMRDSANELTSAMVLLTLVVLVAAITIHASPGNIHLEGEGLEASLWFSVYTLLAGEPIGGMPATQFGRAITLALMLGGLTVFGVFVGAVSASMVRILSREMENESMELDELFEHVVVLGWNHAGPALLRELFGPDNPPSQSVLLVTEDAALPVDMPTTGVRPERLYHLSGDYTRVEVLERAGIRRAASAILLRDATRSRSFADQDARTVLAALAIERLAPRIFCCAQLHDGQHEEMLRMYGVEEIVIGDWFTGVILGSIGRNQGLVAVLNDILTTTSGNAFHKVVVPKSLDGHSFGEVFNTLKTRHGAILVSMERDTNNKRDVKVNPSCDERLATGDVLVVIAPRAIEL